MIISVVIPTFNRPDLVRSVLNSIANQTLRPAQIIIVDASDDKRPLSAIAAEFPLLTIETLDSIPSVCIQRNLGIRKARSPWIFLCDDDIQLPPDYLQCLSEYLTRHPECGVVSGQLLQMEGGVWVDSYPPKNFFDLLWRFIFQLSVWGDISQIKVPAMWTRIGRAIKSFYQKRGNNLSLAGWPLITSYGGDVFRTKIYSLGANLVRREWLLNSPYDEVLDRSGIGDNFGVALGFGGDCPIHVVRATHAYHHRSGQNRLASSLSYYRRILALDYFLRLKRRGSFRWWLAWSLIGNLLMYARKKDMAKIRATWKAFKAVLLNRNPYMQGHVKNQKIVQPAL